MKKFSDMTTGEVINVINNSKELRDSLDNSIQETEMDYISDKLACFDHGAVEYSIGFFDRNYFYIKDNELFLEGVRKSHDDYGLSNDAEKLLERCEKLRDTNLFGYWCKKLCEKYYKEELKSSVDWVEDVSYELYCGSVGEKSRDYVDDFIDNYIGDYLWDEEAETFYKLCKVSA